MSVRLSGASALALSIAMALATVPASAQEMDHAAMGHDMPVDGRLVDEIAASDQKSDKPLDHAAMDHSKMDHSGMGHDMPIDDADANDTDLPATAPPINPIPAITRADRIAAFPDVDDHAMHDNDIHSYWLFDRLELWDAEQGSGAGWEAMAWIGTDIDRLWLRSEGEHVDGTTESADIEVLYGRAIAPWWDLVAGLRHDFGEGPSQTFAAIGVQGLSPYKFEVEATAYIGQSGQTAANLEIEYETLFTNRLIGQWLVEAEAWGQDDPERGIGAGLGTVEAGFRLRYEFDRQFAPYIGVVWERAYGDTADLRRDDGHAVEDTRVVVGLRTWF